MADLEGGDEGAPVDVDDDVEGPAPRVVAAARAEVLRVPVPRAPEPPPVARGPADGADDAADAGDEAYAARRSPRRAAGPADRAPAAAAGTPGRAVLGGEVEAPAPLEGLGRGDERAEVERPPEPPEHVDVERRGRGRRARRGRAGRREEAHGQGQRERERRVVAEPAPRARGRAAGAAAAARRAARGARAAREPEARRGDAVGRVPGPDAPLDEDELPGRAELVPERRRRRRRRGLEHALVEALVAERHEEAAVGRVRAAEPEAVVERPARAPAAGRRAPRPRSPRAARRATARR